VGAERNDAWSCGGWTDHERGQLLHGADLSFRERLLWLEEADRLAALLEASRAWIDDEGVVHEPSPQPASTQAPNAGGSG
jgi:hypothetical protein